MSYHVWVGVYYEKTPTQHQVVYKESFSLMVVAIFGQKTLHGKLQKISSNDIKKFMSWVFKKAFNFKQIFVDLNEKTRFRST